MAVRSPFAGYLPLVVGVRSIPVAPVRHESIGAALRAAAKALRRGSVLRWLTVLEATDLMGDVLLGYLALYFVDVVGLSPVAAAGVIVIWTVAGLVGDALLLLVLEHASGVTYLRLSAVTALFVYPAFLLAGSAALKIALLALLAILHAGWYAIPQAGCLPRCGR
ncbi:MAG: hypothetical protein M3024_05615 [Candidatus Dormibacteraeota bacterium]|nr:hypothetical protein [Candidatus Dormibacteraeota bacterium]